MAETVLITGGAGFIGAYVVRRLLAAGFRIVVYDAKVRDNALSLLPDIPAEGADLAIETGAITDRALLLDLCRRHDIGSAVHLASPLTQDVTDDPTAGIRDICLGTAALFDAARDAGLRRVVWASSVAVFGPSGIYPPVPLPDDAPHRPATVYGSCKSLCENLALRAHRADGLDVVGLRLSVVYGAGRLRGYMSYPSHLLRAAAAGEAVHIPYGRQRLHWQHVEEVAAMIATALCSSRSGAGRTYNGLGDSRTWREAAAILQQARPTLRMTVGEDMDPALADVVEDYDAGAFSRDYAYAMGWPLERGVSDTLDGYERIAANTRSFSRPRSPT